MNRLNKFPVSFSMVWCGFCFISGLVISSFGQAPETKSPVVDLMPEPGHSLAREIGGEQKHAYKLTLSANQYAVVQVEQKGIDVTLRILKPDGAELVKLDSPNGKDGPESIAIVAENPGEYQIEIFPTDSKAAGGRYEAQIKEIRDATPVDAKVFKATVNYVNAKILRELRKADKAREAIKLFDEAARLFEELGNKREQAQALHESALTHQLLGEYKTAIEMYKQAADLSHAVNDPETEKASFNNIGFIYNRTADFQNALVFYYRALNIARQMNSQRDVYRSMANIATAYNDMGEAEKAVEYYLQVLPFFEQQGDKFNEALNLSNLGSAYATLGQFEKSLEVRFKALPFWKTFRQRVGEIVMLNNIADTYLSMGETQKALDYFNQGLNISKTNNSPIEFANSNFGLGKTYFKLNDFDKATEHLNAALKGFRENAQKSAAVILTLARTEKAKGNTEQAQKYTEDSLTLIESVRRKIGDDESRSNFFARYREFYDFYIALLMERHKQDPSQNYLNEALAASERARARGLLEMLNRAKADIRQNVDATLLEREKDILQKLNNKAAQLSRLMLTSASEEQARQEQNEFQRLNDEYNQVQSQIRVTSPHYAALTQPVTLTVKEIRQQVLDSDTALLEYSLGEKTSYLWIVTTDSIQAFELAGRQEIENKAKTFYDALTARNRKIKFETPEEREARISKSDAGLLNASADLSHMILAPASRLLNKKRLLIVADGALQYVPFTALQLGDKKNKAENALINQYEIVNLPSASTLAVLRRELKDRQPSPKSLAVLADPVFSLDDERLKRDALKKKPSPAKESVAIVRSSYPENSSELPESLTGTKDDDEAVQISRLPFTRKEAYSIGSFNQPEQRREILDFEANRHAALDPELAQYQIIHFATHSFINSKNPELSGILLSLFDKDGQSRDGFLRLNDIYNLKFPAELVVLSGCRTGLGKEIRGEGLIGLTRGFMYAGARRVTVSLWDVNDEATFELMTRFYRGILKDKLSPATALKQAQISMQKDPRWQSPYFWAAFAIQGEPK